MKVTTDSAPSAELYEKDVIDYVNSVPDSELREHLKHQVRLRDNLRKDRDSFERQHMELSLKYQQLLKTKPMGIKVTTPQEMNATTEQIVKEVVEKFELEFRKEDKTESYYHIVISGEYNRATLDEVEKIYKQAGWVDVKCRTSTENGERGGLTGLILSTTKEEL